MKAHDSMTMTQVSPLALDIRLMNLTSMLLMLVLSLAMVTVLAWWLLRHPVFALSEILFRAMCGITMSLPYVPMLCLGYREVFLQWTCCRPGLHLKMYLGYVKLW